MNSIKLATLVSGLSLLLLNPALAQTKRSVDFTPHVGWMTPLSDVVEAGDITTGSPAAAHGNDLMFGGLLTFWWSPAWAFELGGMYAPNAIGSDAFSIPGEVDTEFISASARLVYDFGQNPSKPAVMLTGGLGAFFTTYDAPLDMTTGGMGLVSLGLRIPITTGFGIRLDVTDYMTFTNWDRGDGSETDRVWQNDLTFKGGLVFSFGKHVQ